MNAAAGLDRVDLWVVKFSDLDPATRYRCEELLSVEEVVRLRRFRRPAAADQYLLGRALVRSTLSRYAAVRPGVWRFGRSPLGRPFVDQPGDARHLCFNLSHTEGLVAMAVGLETQIGLDVENRSRIRCVEGLAQHCLSAQERLVMTQLVHEADVLDRFLRIWTLKEAYVKARGVGLTVSLGSFGFRFDNGTPQLQCLPECGDTPEGWQFLEHLALPDHRLALAFRGSARSKVQCRVHWIGVSDLGGEA